MTDRLRTDALHVFCIETAEDADAFLRRYAGRQCAQQLLVVDPAMWTDDERGRALRAYAAVAMDSGFAHNFFEVFASKAAALLRTTRESTATDDGGKCDRWGSRATAAAAAVAGAASTSPGSRDGSPMEEEETWWQAAVAACPPLKDARRIASALDPNHVPPTPLVERVEVKSVEAKGFSSLMRFAQMLGDRPVHTYGDGSILSVGLSLSLHRTQVVSMRGLLLMMAQVMLVSMFSPSTVGPAAAFAFLIQLALYLTLAAFTALPHPCRMGRLAALAKLRPPEGFHFLIGYEDAYGKKRGAVPRVGAQPLGASVWLDVYRLENAYPLQQSVYHAAGRSAFVVLVVTPRFVGARTVARRCWRRCDVGLSTCWRGLTRAPSGTSASTIGSAGFCRRSSFAW